MRQKKRGKMQSNINSLFSGQRVICINDRFQTHILEWTANLPRQGRIYTIRSIEIGHCLYTRQWTLGFHLQELPTIEDRLAFRADRFASLLEKVDQACQAKALEPTLPAPVSPPMLVPATNGAQNVQVCLPVSRLRRRLGQRKRLENAAIREAVLKAAAQERRKAVFTLFGRGHEPRVSLSVSMAAVLRGLNIPRVYISGYRRPNYYYPRRVFVSAAKMLRKKLRRSPIVVGHKVYRALRRQNY
jgi:hypothetical protein